MNKPGKKVARLEKREQKLLTKANKAVDDGNAYQLYRKVNKADRLLRRAANVENRIINLKERDTPLPSSNF